MKDLNIFVLMIAIFSVLGVYAATSLKTDTHADQISTAPGAVAWEYKVVSFYHLTGVDSMMDLMRDTERNSANRRAPNFKTGSHQQDLSTIFSNLEKLGKRVTDQVGTKMEEGLNRLGQQGWELISYKEKEQLYCFKRRSAN